MMAFKRLAALLCVVAMLSVMVSCAQTGGGDTNGVEQGTYSTIESVGNNKKKGKFPMYDNVLVLGDGEALATGTVPGYAPQASRFTDMVGMAEEVAASRLTDAGVFEKAETFNPDQTVTVEQFLGWLFKLSGIKNAGALLDKAVKTNLIEKGVITDIAHNLTREELAYLADRAVADRDQTEQFEMMLSDYASITESMRASVLQCIGLGILESGTTFSPKQEVTKAEAAEVLYRIANVGARADAPYELGANYDKTANSYLVKAMYEANESGIQFGFFTNNTWQDKAFALFGKRPIDRTYSYTWAVTETKSHIYVLPDFSNDKNAHLSGSTAVVRVDVSFPDAIPGFYEKDYTNQQTQTYAKQFLYTFTTQLMNTIEGSVILMVDAGFNEELGLTAADDATVKKAETYAAWYKELVEVARNAAINGGRPNNLKIMATYSGVNALQKHSDSSGWMKTIADASDYVGLSTFNIGPDKSDATYTLQDTRFIIQNCAFGKPVMVVENGVPTDEDGGTATAAAYYQNLFRELRFSLEEGEYLNGQLAGFLFYSLRDEKGEEQTYGVSDSKGLRESGTVINSGLQSIEKQKQFSSVLTNAESVPAEGTTVTVNDGVTYEKLTYIVKDFTTADGKGKLNVTLEKAGAVSIVVNGEYAYVSRKLKAEHSISIKEGLQNGFNQIEIYFASDALPAQLTVLAVSLE